MQPIELRYGSKSFMMSKLDAMGYTGSAAAAAKRIRAPIDDSDTDAGRRAARSHLQKHLADEQQNAIARDAVRRAQNAAMHGVPLDAYAQVLLENPNDNFVQDEPRQHPYYVRSAHVSAPDVANTVAREPWRMTIKQINEGSIKHMPTQADQ